MGENRDIIRKFSEIELPSEIIEKLDLEKIAKDYKKKFKKLDKYKEYKEYRDQAWFGKKWYLAFSGEDSDQLTDAVISQGQLLKMNSELIVLNTIFAKELNRQQKQIDDQQKYIINNNSEIKEQQIKLEKQAKELDAQQKRILDLVHLTDGQEKAIRDLRNRAEKVEELEKEYNNNIIILKASIQEFEKKVNTDYKNLDRENKNNYTLIIESTDKLNSLINKYILEEQTTRSSEMKSLKDSLATHIIDAGEKDSKIKKEFSELKDEVAKSFKSSRVKLIWGFAITLLLFLVLFIKNFS